MKKGKGKLTTWSEFKDEFKGSIGTSARDTYKNTDPIQEQFTQKMNKKCSWNYSKWVWEKKVMLEIK